MKKLIVLSLLLCLSLTPIQTKAMSVSENKPSVQAKDTENLDSFIQAVLGISTYRVVIPDPNDSGGGIDPWESHGDGRPLIGKYGPNP